MASKRDLKLQNYNIGKYAYRELHNFCLQYKEKKKQLTAFAYLDRAKRDTERETCLLSDCKLIEQTAIEAAGEDYPCLLLAVTEDAPHYNLQLVRGLEMGEKRFRQTRKKFYYLLAKKKKII